MITPYQNNAKKHPDLQVSQIAKSIEAFGMNQPIVVDKNGVIIVGHGRYLALQMLGWDIKPEWVIQKDDLTDEQVAAYRLADNKLNESEWNMDLVTEELKGLSAPMLELTGFDKDLLITNSDLDDHVPSVEGDPRTEFGDLYEIGNHRVLCGDSTKAECMQRLMGMRKADMVFTDPPYNVGYVGKTKDELTIDNDSMSDDEFDIFIRAVVTNIFKYCNGVIYVCMSSSEWGTIQSIFKELGGHWSRVIIWVKDRMVLSRADYHTQFEPIAVVNEDVNEEGEPILYGWKENGPRHFFKGGRKQTDVWRINRPTASKEHPTMKPVELCQRAITNNTLEGALVLDLFLGSGSTLIACEKTARACYGMELDEHYMDVIISRWVAYTGINEIIKNGTKIVWQTPT